MADDEEVTDEEALYGCGCLFLVFIIAVLGFSEYRFGFIGVFEDSLESLGDFPIEQADGGNEAAQYKVGNSFYYGYYGIDQSYEKAVYYYKKAAKQGYAKAQNTLGCAYSAGEGVTEDDEKAVYWYKKAAKQGNKYAQYNLGRAYYYGNGVLKDKKKAKKWIKKSHENGYSKAMDFWNEKELWVY